MVEFIVLAVTLAVPLVYVLIAVFDVQRVSFGASAATREAARVFVRAPSTVQAQQQAETAAAITLQDHGVDVADGDLEVSCTATPCLTPGGTVQFTYRTRVPLPLVPFVSDELASISVEATHTQVVDRYSQVRP
jgi:hypothetical protein